MQQSEGRYGALLAARIEPARKQDMRHVRAKLVQDDYVSNEFLMDLDQGPVMFRESMRRQTLVDPESGAELWSRTSDDWKYE